MIDNRNYTGKSIKARRNQLKMSQETLAEKANTTQSTISKIERGINDPPFQIKSVVESYGLKITSTQQPNGVCAISTLEKIYDKYGQAVMDMTLRLAVATWEGETNSLSGNMLMGIARIIVAYGDQIKEDVFKDHVGMVSVKSIIRTAKERRPGAMGFAEAMMLAYNNKNKYQLSLRTLYGAKKNVSGDNEDAGVEIAEESNQTSNKYLLKNEE